MLCSFTPLESCTPDDRNVKRRHPFNMRSKVKASPFLTGFPTRFRNFIWFLIFTFTLYCMPHFELIFPYEIHFHLAEAEAAESNPKEEDTSKAISSDKSTTKEGVSADKESTEKKSTEEKAVASSGVPLMSQGAQMEEDGGGGGVLGLSLHTPEPFLFTGAATYRVPIQVPPGRGGMAPTISLTYNSYQGSGWVGVGWGLDLGGIQRSTKRGLNYSANDYVGSVNGSNSELIARSDWGTNYYGDKIEGAYNKYYYNSTSGGWEVTTKDGTKLYYGRTSASRQDNAYGVFKWCLDKVQDTKGNYMTVTYSKDQGEIYPDRIDYTGNGSLNPTNYVKFYLESRTDAPPMYTLNTEVKTAYRLKTIEVYGNGLFQRKYVLNYTYSPNSTRSLLNSVIQYGNDGVTTLPETTFVLTQGINNFTSPSMWVGHDKGGYARYADVNGDGKADLIFQTFDREWEHNEEIYLLGNKFWVSLSTGSGFTSPALWAENTNLLQAGHAQYADLNGDGKTDLIFQDGGNDFWVSLSTGSGFTPSALWLDHGDIFRRGQAHYVDVNGDGKADLIFQSYYNTFLVSLSTGSSFTTPATWVQHSGEFQEGQAQYADLNGDGNADLIFQDGYNDFWVSLSTGSGFTTPACWVQHSGEYQEGGQAQYADLNGDGKADLIFQDGNNSFWVSLSTGSSMTTPSVWVDHGGTFVKGQAQYADLNGDGKADLIFQGGGSNFWVSLSTGSSFTTPSVWVVYGGAFQAADANGDGKADLIFQDGLNDFWVSLSAGPYADLLSTATNGIGGTSTISYTTSSAYTNTLMPFVLQTVSSISVDDEKGNLSTSTFTYEGGFFDYADREFRGFRKVTSFQMFDSQYYESKTETWFLQDYFRKGKIETQILTSAERHTRRVDNIWENISTPGGGYFPSLKETTSIITDIGYPSYSHRSTYIYDQYINVTEEHKYGMTTEDEIHTYFSYTNFADIHSKPTEINVKNASQSIVSRKWMDYDSNTGNVVTEEVCKSDTPNTGCASRNATQNPVITYEYYPEGNLWKITDPRNYTTTVNYDATKTFVYETINTLGHKTTTEYDPGTGNLKKLIPPHLQGTAYSITNTFDVFGRKIREDRPDGGWTSYQYVNFGNSTAQYVETREHIIGGGGGAGPFDHYTFKFFDGLGRTYWVESTGPDGKRLITETWYDNLGRISDASNPYFYGIDTPYYTTFVYDGLSRVIETYTPDDYYILTEYQGLRKVVTDQNDHSTAYTNDVYQRLRKVEDAYGTITEYNYDTLGNLIQVIAAKGNTEQNTTTITYDSLSKKRSMNDPDMGQWTYDYDKSGNLELQTDAKGQKIRFKYDGLNRVYEKRYGDPTPLSTVYFTYDQISIGKLNKVSYQPSGEDLREDIVIECDLMQRTTKSQKTIGAQSVTFETSYDTAGRSLSIKYLAGTPNEKTYSYEYDMAGNLLYVKDNATGNHLVDYSDFTALGQQKIATFPKPGNVSVKTTYTYDPPTARLKTLLTQKLLGANPTDTYQNLDYQQFDGKGNLITLADTLNGITHSYTYDSLDRLLTANGVGTNPYSHSFQYDRIGNIIYKSDFGTYSYNYSNKPHAVRSVVTDRPVYNDPVMTIVYNYDNKPASITKGSTTVSFTYDGNGQRVKKQSSVSGTTLYFGGLYEVRGGVGIIHVFAGNKRVASVFVDGRTQFYHSNHLGSSSVITDHNGDKKEKMEYFPFGEYRAVGDTNGTYDYDAFFPDVFYTFTGQEDDDDLGLYNYGARLYDPVLGRFISPDRLVPEPGNLQAFNRYTYCLNNPLIYTDPSGEEIALWLVGLITAVLMSAFSGACEAHMSGQNWFEGALVGAVIGAASFGAGYAVGFYITPVVTSFLDIVWKAGSPSISPVVGAMAGGFAGGAVSGGLNAAVYGGNPWQAALYGGLMAAAFAGLVAGAIELNGANGLEIGGPPNKSKVASDKEIQEFMKKHNIKFPESPDWPTCYSVVTKTFNDSHTGTDMRSYLDMPSVTTEKGTVIEVGPDPTNSKITRIMIQHDQGYITKYYHQTPLVKVGDIVLKGGLVGYSEFWSDGAHLHFELSLDGSKYLSIDALKYYFRQGTYKFK